MAILCNQQNVTIGRINSLICDILVRISNIQPKESTIDIEIDNTFINPEVGTEENSFEHNGNWITIKLISKDVLEGTAIINFTVSDLPIQEYTDTIKIFIRPWGWYTPNQAADKIVSKLTDIMGTVINYLDTIIDYSYIRTDILVEGDYVTLNIRLKNINPSTLAEPVTIGLGTIVGILIITIIITFGLIVYANWIKEDTGNKKESYQATPNEQLPGTKTANVDAQSNCLTGLPENPNCEQLKTYAICLDSVHIGLYGTLKSEFPNSEEVKTQYDEHLQKYTKIMLDCDENTVGKTPADKKSQIVEEQKIYISKLETTFNKLQKDYESNLCLIPSPFGGCLISNKSGKTILFIGGALGLVYLYSKYKKK